ncbi:MAG: hypothetical protein ISR97_04375 [Nitrospira sp.]|nr:hypothetical protein [Nitrospira sp.]
MLKYIPLIASVISALTAVTSSFRALGRSREKDFPTGSTADRLKGLSLHLFVTFVWFGLSIIFAVPLIKEHLSTSLLPLIAPFALLMIICFLIWWKALSIRN